MHQKRQLNTCYIHPHTTTTWSVYNRCQKQPRLQTLLRICSSSVTKRKQPTLSRHRLVIWALLCIWLRMTVACLLPDPTEWYAWPVWAVYLVLRCCLNLELWNAPHPLSQSCVSTSILQYSVTLIGYSMTCYIMWEPWSISDSQLQHLHNNRLEFACSRNFARHLHGLDSLQK